MDTVSLLQTDRQTYRQTDGLTDRQTEEKFAQKISGGGW